MKKVLAIALALVMALSMSAMAFAEDTTTTTTTTKAVVIINDCPYCDAKFSDEGEYNAHLAICVIKTCPKCKEVFADESAYNEHVANCTVGDTKDYINLDIKTILDMIIDLVKSSKEQWGDIESVVVRLVDFIESMGTLAAPQADVEGAVADLEAALADVEIPGLSDLLNQLKAKIKAMYAGEVATTVEVVETTVAAPVADTGSSAAGIAAFAAISVAAAAAYVCTKKSK